MPSVGTGAMLANKKLIAIGISGDGDTGAIGIGQFVHLMRRNLPIIYIIEDNGCYGLTKGQFSPTADLGSKLKTGVVNDLPPLDTCALAIELGATFVARSFSGDKKQLLSLLKAALAHRGTVMLDVISPCVTFNDHEGSTKSYAYVKDHDDPLEEVTFVPFFEDITVDYEPGSSQEVTMHDGSKLYLRKLEEGYDPTDKINALRRLHETARRGEFATGIVYIEPDRDDFLTLLNVVDEPLASLPLERVRPKKEALEEIMEGLCATLLIRARSHQFDAPPSQRGTAYTAQVSRKSSQVCAPPSRPHGAPNCTSNPLLPCDFVLVRANSILGRRREIVRQSIGIDAFAVRIALLFVRRPIAFDGAFMDVGIGVGAEGWCVMCHPGSPQKVAWKSRLL